MNTKVNARLILAVVSTFFEEAVFAVIMLLVLPKWNITTPWWAVVLALVAWTGFSTFTYRMGGRALKQKQVTGLHNMVGCEGEVVNRLAPEGMVRIKGELWRARSDSGDIKEGTDVTVTGQDRLELTVQKKSG